ncbi:MAG TPA: LexA family transcriptional regulator [Allosphingosinicella sp.]|nr:LexA family transcriptional regulator [Allosphingosinicella sp.]
MDMADEDIDLTSAPGRLKWARRRRYDNAADFARAARVPEVTYRAYENGQNGFSKHAADFAERLDVPTDWLLRGGPLPGADLPTNLVPDILPTRPVQEGEGSIPLRLLDLDLSMGDGTNIDDFVEEGTIDFDASLLRKITYSPPERIFVARGSGDSMFPTLVNGDMVVVDTLQRRLNLQHRIWAISLFGAGGIKRLQPIAQNRVEVISDNPLRDNRVVDAEDLRILGRVVWIGREV